MRPLLLISRSSGMGGLHRLLTEIIGPVLLNERKEQNLAGEPYVHVHLHQQIAFPVQVFPPLHAAAWTP